MSQPTTNQSRPARGNLVAGIVCAALAVVVVIGIIVYAVTSKHDSASGSLTPPNANADSSGIIANPGVAQPGVPTLTVYQDYQCPACARVDSVLSKPLDSLANSGQIILEYRTMTFLDTNLHNDSSRRAAIAAACADIAGHYQAYHDTIYANQPSAEGTGYTDQQLRVDFAANAGITDKVLHTFQKCYDNKSTADFVTHAATIASQAGINSTPTYRVNGKKWDLTQVTTIDEASLARQINTLAGK